MAFRDFLSLSLVRIRTAVGCLLAGILVIPTQLPAQSVLMEEVVVTAQKREQDIQDVGISVTAFSGEQMSALGFGQSIDVARMTPGMHIGGSIAGQNVQFTIRGVTQNDFGDAVESPISVYLDEGYIALGQGQTFSLFDIERVEIAKGPQSTLFGRNANGGVIQYLTRKPTREAEAYGEVTFGDYEQFKFESAISGPLTDTLSARAAVMYSRFDEILKNNYTAADAPISPFSGLPMAGSPGGGEDMWNDHTYGVRLHLLFEPNDDVELLLSANYSETDIGSGPYQSSASVPVFDSQGRLVNTIHASPTETCEAITLGASGCTPVPYVDGEDPGVAGMFVVIPTAAENGTRPVAGGDFFGYRDADGDGWNTKGDFAYDDLNTFETLGVTAKLTWDFDSVTLTSVSDFKDYEKSNLMDVDAGPVPQSIFQSMTDATQYSQELRLNADWDGLRWVAGLYLLNIDNETVNGLALPAGSPLLGVGGFDPAVGLLVVPFAGLDANNLIDLETDSYSAFGQVEYDLNDTLTLIGGLRVVREEKDYNLSTIAYANLDDRIIDTSIEVFPLALDSLGGFTFSESPSETLWAGKLQLDWHPNDDLLVYAGINRGVKAGSFNAQLADGSPRLAPSEIGYDKEELTSYEAGFKSSVLDGKAHLNGSLFYYDYSDYQAFVFVQSSGTVTNNDANTVGVELEFVANPFDGFDLMLSAAYFNAEVEDLELDPTLLVDVEPSFAPELQFAGLARYEWAALGGTMALQADFNYSDEFYFNIRNFDSQRYDDYIVGNVRASYTSQDEKWSAAAFINNFTDERYGVIGYDLSTLCGCNEDLYGKPRWWGVTLRFNFL